MTKKEIVDKLVEIRLKDEGLEPNDKKAYLYRCYYNCYKKKELKVFLELELHIF